MRRLVVPLIGIALVGVAFGTVYRYFLNDPSEASVSWGGSDAAIWLVNGCYSRCCCA